MTTEILKPDLYLKAVFPKLIKTGAPLLKVIKSVTPGLYFVCLSSTFRGKLSLLPYYYTPWVYKLQLWLSVVFQIFDRKAAKILFSHSTPLKQVHGTHVGNDCCKICMSIFSLSFHTFSYCMVPFLTFTDTALVTIGCLNITWHNILTYRKLCYVIFTISYHAFPYHIDV